MNKDLLTITNNFASVMKSCNGVLGAWNFGSVLYGMSDEYSDADIVFLLENRNFKKIKEDLTRLLLKVCDSILLCFKESFNSDAIINNGYLIKKNNDIFQFDIFLLNNGMLDDFMCKIHYAGLSAENIIFDTDNNVLKLCNNNPDGSLWNDNICCLAETYLYHFYMTYKYLARQDYFKLNHIMRTLYDIHVSLLLTGYDQIKWGGAENKLHFIPVCKQEHLKKYYCTEDFQHNKNNLLQSFIWFEEDIKDVSAKKGQDYNAENIDIIKNFWML